VDCSNHIQQQLLISKAGGSQQQQQQQQQWSQAAVSAAAVEAEAVLRTAGLWRGPSEASVGDSH
jgi:hypothetical protein